jgi:uncharacterized membrane protein YkvA (DUF1232 family)
VADVADMHAACVLGREVATFVPDVVAMLRGVLGDPRLPRSAKVQAGAALAYLVSPRNRLTNIVPVLGQLDDVAIVALAFRRLLLAAGEDLPREHWRGSDRAFGLLLSASTALASPRGTLRKIQLVRGFTEASSSRARRREESRVVDGEVVGRS